MHAGHGTELQISAVIPTRGDVDLGPIVDRLREYPEVRQIIIEIGDTPFNRYLGAEKARYPVIYTQDDDCITDIRPLIERYRPAILVNAMTAEHEPNYRGQRDTLIGFGGIFHRDRLSVLNGWERDPLFLRESDRVFTSLVPYETVFPQIEILDCSCNGDRMWKQPEHTKAGEQIRERINVFLRTHPC